MLGVDGPAVGPVALGRAPGATHSPPPKLPSGPPDPARSAVMTYPDRATSTTAAASFARWLGAGAAGRSTAAAGATSGAAWRGVYARRSLKDTADTSAPNP